MAYVPVAVSPSGLSCGCVAGKRGGENRGGMHPSGMSPWRDPPHTFSQSLCDRGRRQSINWLPGPLSLTVSHRQRGDLTRLHRDAMDDGVFHGRGGAHNPLG